MVDMARPRGTRDFAPAEMAVRNHVAGLMRGVFGRFGYREVATPTFEELGLFTAKSGQGIVEELYNFKDKGDRDMCLRPELTAPVMRMYYQDHFNDPKPIKWFYHGACYRYDRPQAGRYREFWQFGCEQIGAGTPLAYAELLALADAVMREVGLTERELFVGHVGILKAVMGAWEFPAAADIKGALRLVDKQDWPELRKMLRACANHTAEREASLIDMLTYTSTTFASTFLQTMSNANIFGVLENEVRELEQTLAHLAAFGVENVKLNLGIARGLDYYTGIVFEMHCPILGAEKQLLGGGGYDLSAVFGGQPTPTMGFGLGFDRTIVALEKQAELAGKKRAFPPVAGPVVYFAALSDAASKQVLPIVSQLRKAGVAVEMDLAGRKPGAVAKHADAVGARYLVIIGDRDLEAGKVQVKELGTGIARDVGLRDLPALLGAS